MPMVTWTKLDVQGQQLNPKPYVYVLGADIAIGAATNELPPAAVKK